MSADTQVLNAAEPSQSGAPIVKPTMSKREAAALLGVDERTLGRGIEDGTVKAIKLGKRVLVLREPLMRMLAGDAA